jgi:tRNA pseudouridine38-40 synthase
MKYLIKIRYDGTKFHGFQRQNNVRNVQGSIETILSNVLKEKIVIKGAGRTDAFVHALCQCASFDVSKKITLKDKLKINKILGKDLKIYKYKVVSEDFHARFCVKEKTYLYKINVGAYNLKKTGYYYQVKLNLDYQSMLDACHILEGTHDYRNFVSGNRIDYTSTIFSIKLKRKKDTILLYFRGIGFYRYMVRHLVGAILDVGKKRITLEQLQDLLDCKIIKSSSVVPADGLYLINVKY